MTTKTKPKLITIQILPGVGPFQLEDFPKKAERSVKGALHLCGNATNDVTADELEALKKARPDLVSKIRVLTLPEKKTEAATPPPEESGNNDESNDESGNNDESGSENKPSGKPSGTKPPSGKPKAGKNK